MAKPELLAHVKFGRLIRALALRRYEALGLLELLWQHCYTTSDDAIGTAEDLAWIVDWPREDAARLAGALVAVGFLDPDPLVSDTYHVHNLWRHAPRYARQRAIRALEDETVEDGTCKNDKTTSCVAPPYRTVPIRKNSGAAAPPLSLRDREDERHETPPIAVLARLCHEIPRAERCEWADAADGLKWQAARFHVPSDGRSVTTALERVARGRGSGFAALLPRRVRTS